MWKLDRLILKCIRKCKEPEPVGHPCRKAAG